jgi:beta-lactamase class A
MLQRKRSRRHPPQRNFNLAAYDQPMIVYHGQQPVSRQNVRRQQRSRFKTRAYLLVSILLVLGFAGHVLWAKHVSAETVAAHEAQVAASAEGRRKVANFASQVNQFIATNPSDTISVATATNTDGLQTYGDTTVFDGASTGKLLTAADYLHHVEKGTASLNQNIDGQTASYWLKIMIINSDDTAWSELNGYLTHPDLLAYANSIGYNNYDPTTNTFTASDTALLLQKLYNGSLLDSSDRGLLLKYLGEANYRQYIVAAVPASYNVYHKIGLDDDTVNDGAIITKGQKYLVLVIFTNGNGSYDWPARAQLMQSITKDAIAAYL